jgi:excisionase family DNA binding protein
MNLLSLKECATRLGFSRQWVWFLIKMGKLQAIKVGNLYVIEEAALQLYQQQSKEVLNVK